MGTKFYLELYEAIVRSRKRMNNQYQDWLDDVLDYGTNLNDVPSKLIDQRICDLAVARQAFAVNYVPKEFMNVELLKLCFISHEPRQSLHNAVSRLEELDMTHLLTEELCWLALENASVFFAIPMDIVNEEFLHAHFKGFEDAHLPYNNEHLGIKDLDPYFERFTLSHSYDEPILSIKYKSGRNEEYTFE